MSYPKDYDNLAFTDDFLFCKILQNNPDICKTLIELVLGKKIRKISYPVTQKPIEITSDGKGVRLDVYVEGDENVYNIEMQTAACGHLPKRSRYYQGMIDLNTIERGDDYKKLKNTYIIFLCLFDPFKKYQIRYTFQRKCVEVPELDFNDGSHIVFINPFGMPDGLTEDQKALMSYLRGESIAIADPFIQQIEEEVQKARTHEEWRLEFMTLQMRDQENLEKGREEGKKEGQMLERIQTVKNMINAGISDEQIRNILHFSEKELKEIKEKIPKETHES